MTVLSVLTALAQTLIIISPLCIVAGIVKERRNAVYVSPEMLILLVVSFAVRYREIWEQILSFALMREKIHLLGLGAATYLVIYWQSRMRLPAPKPEALVPLNETHNDGAAEEAESTLPESPAPAPIKRMRIDWDLVFVNIFMTLVLGACSIVGPRIARWIDSQPQPALTTDLAQQIPFCDGLLALIAISIQYWRDWRTKRGIANMPRPEPFDEELFKKRVRVQNFMWAFFIASQLGEAGMIPSLIAKLKDAEVHSMKPNLERIVFAFFHLIGLIGFVVAIKYVPVKKRRDTEQGEEESSTAPIRL